LLPVLPMEAWRLTYIHSFAKDNVHFGGSLDWLMTWSRATADRRYGKTEHKAKAAIRDTLRKQTGRLLQNRRWKVYNNTIQP
jgi:hypothetical protein